MKALIFYGLTLSLLLASCATSQPEQLGLTNRGVKPIGTGETEYQFPENNPIGNLRIRFLGIESFFPGDGSQIPALHLILSASNSGKNGDWELHSKDLSVSFNNGMQSPLLSANPEDMEIKPEGHFGMDLYFSLPKGLEQTDLFHFHWKVKVLGSNYIKTTTFKIAHAPEDQQPDWGVYHPLSGLMFGPAAGLF